MAFKKQKTDRRKLDAPIFSGAAEVCETRALLSADGVCLPAVDADAVVIEDIEATDSEEVVDVDATVEDLEFIPEMLTCEMFPIPIIEGEVPEDLGGGDENAVVIEDIEATDSEEVVDVDATVEDLEFIPEMSNCEIEEFDDVTTLEDYDPSWAYRTFIKGVPEDGTEVTEDVFDGEEKPEIVEEELVDIIMLEDYDPWANREPLPLVDGEKFVDEEEVVAEDGEVTEEEIVHLQDGYVDVEDGGEVPVRYYFGMNFRGNTGGELHAEALSMTSGVPSTDSTPSVMGPVATSTPVATPAVNVPVVVNQPASLPVVVSPTLAIPLNNGGFTPLFLEEDELLVTTLAPVVSEIEPLVSEVEDTVLSGLDSPFGDLIGSSSDSSDAPVGELTPIFGEEQDGEKPEEVPAAEDVPVETEESVGSVEAPQQPVVVASRASYGRSIDEFMSEFAMSGFAG